MKGRQIIYSAREIAWLEANRLMVISDYHRAFCAKFRRDDVSLLNLHSLRKRKGWKTGRTGCFAKGLVPHNKGKKCPPGKGGRHPNARCHQFKKGHLPHNTKYLGHERVSKGGYVEISVDERNPHTGYERRYVLKHVWLWEKENGAVPEGHALKCLDGDKTNCDPSNWEAIPRAMLPQLSGRHGLPYDHAAPEVKPVLMTLAKLANAKRETKKKNREGGGVAA